LYSQASIERWDEKKPMFFVVAVVLLKNKNVQTYVAMFFGSFIYNNIIK